MAKWLPVLRDLTKVHREDRARRFDAGAKRRRALARLRGAREVSVQQDARWHVARAEGQRNKIENVQSCGSARIQITCQSCGASRERPGRCGNALLCVSCRGALAAEKRRKFLLARAAVLASAARRGLLAPRRGGRYSEKFLTLTSPPLTGDSVASRIARTAEAWVIFRRWLKKYCKSRGAPTLEWFRVLEWTPGKSDGFGHPHLHLWLFSCFLDVEALRDAWRLALIKAGAPSESCRVVIIDIQEFEPRGGRGAQELIKYLTKDIDENGKKISPEVYAEVYKAFDGRRITQASRGFMALGEQEAMRCECGACLPRRVRKLPPAAPAKLGAEADVE